jgi:hypothetical protein
MSCPDDSPYRRVAAALTGAMMAFLPAASAQAQFDPYVVDRLAVSAEAGDAVAAKDEALAEAVSEAFGRILDRVTVAAERRGLPPVGPATSDQFLDRLSIHSERVGPQSYAAEVSVVFSKLAIRGFLAQHGVRAVDEPAPPVLLIPVLVEDGIPLWWDAAEGWAKALANIRFEDGLTPVNLPGNTPADRTERMDRILSADRVTLGNFRVRYRTHGVVTVVAEPTRGRDRVRLRLIGEDAAGPLDLEAMVAAGGLPAAGERVRAILSERWKDAMRGVTGAQLAEARALAVRVLLHGGEAEWTDIRRRLEASGLLQGIAVESTSPNSVSVLVWHDGQPADLADRLTRHRLDLFEAGGAWLLQSY